MKSIQSFITPSTSPYKSYRDELISKLTSHLNRERKGTTYEPVTKARIAMRVNRNPFLAGKNNDGELNMLIDRCLENGDFKYFWFITR